MVNNRDCLSSYILNKKSAILLLFVFKRKCSLLNGDMEINLELI